MGHQVEHASHRGSAAHGQHHVAELRHGAVGQAFFEIHLGEGDGGAQEAGDGAHHGDHQPHAWELGVQGLKTGNEEHTRRHHGGGVDQG